MLTAAVLPELAKKKKKNYLIFLKMILDLRSIILDHPRSGDRFTSTNQWIYIIDQTTNRIVDLYRIVIQILTNIGGVL
jgi:hypothetical protein